MKYSTCNLNCSKPLKSSERPNTRHRHPLSDNVQLSDVLIPSINCAAFHMFGGLKRTP